MRIRTSLFALGLCASGTLASADTLLGHVPIGISGTFTMGLTNCTGTPSGTYTATYVKNTVTGVVTLNLPALFCTSAAPATALTNVPTEIAPSVAMRMPVNVVKGTGVVVPGEISASAGATSFTLSAWNGTTIHPTVGWVTGEAKGIINAGTTITYQSTPDP